MMNRRSFLGLVAAGLGAAWASSKKTYAVLTSRTETPLLTEAPTALSSFIAQPPFSFTYDQQPSTVLLRQWPHVAQPVSSSPGRNEYQVTWAEPHGQLQVRASVVLYPGYETTEWTISFINSSKARSKLLRDVLAADTVLNRDVRGDYILHHFNGSADRADDYAPKTSYVEGGRRFLLYPQGGRPSNGTWPYLNVSWGREGAIVAIGWPGQWTVQLLLEDNRGLSLQGGMSSADPQQHSYDNINDAKLLDTFLDAGEEIRLPLVVLMDWEAGSWLLAQNKWRRWMVDFNLPRFGGSLPTPIMPTTGDLSLLPDQGQETSAIAIFSNRGTTRDRGGFYTHWWVDAGWYAIPQSADQTWYYGVGDWFPESEALPEGFPDVQPSGEARYEVAAVERARKSDAGHRFVQEPPGLADCSP